MLKFKTITLEDKNWMTNYYKKRNFPSTKHSFAGNFVWKLVYDVACCEDDGFLFVKSSYYPGRPAFLCPVGEGDLEAAIEKIREYSKGYDVPLKIYGIYETEKKRLEEIYGGKIKLEYLRDDSDYIYDREKLALLPGKKYHGKRNHIARFKDLPWHYEALNDNNLQKCIDMHKKWARNNGVCHYGSDPALLEESCASLQAFHFYKELGLKGGVLFREDEVVAYTMGEALTDDTFIVHFEKAHADIQGAYPLINQQFVLSEMEGFRYVNREEDTGDEGLRKAKLSYHPAFLLDEYSAVFE